jgi:hypothetical protein
VSSIDTLRAKFYRKPIPNDITFDELFRLAKAYGCIVDTKGGKHPIRIIYKPLGKVIPIPRHSKCVGEAYIKELKVLFTEIADSKEI